MASSLETPAGWQARPPSAPHPTAPCLPATQPAQPPPARHAAPAAAPAEPVRTLLTTEIPRVMEAARAYGQARTPSSALSRGIAGLAGRTIVATFPGSRRGAEETLAALLTGLVHLVDVVRKTHPHDGGYE